MNFKISRKEFLDVLNLVSRAVSSTTPLPILTGIKITVTENSLILVASDSNISIKTAVNANDNNVLIINETGEIVIDKNYILDIVRKTDDAYINFETIDGNLIKIYGENSEFTINGIDANDFPNISFDLSNSQPFKIKTSLFNNLIEKTSFACSDKDSRPVLTGVNFKAHDCKLHVNATDSYRLASEVVELDTDLNFDITVPAKYLNEISKAIEFESEITIVINNQKISFVYGNTIIETRLLDDQFPDTSRLVPSVYTHELEVNSRALLNAIDRTSFIKSDGKSNIKISVNDRFLEISASNQIGSSFTKIPVISFIGDPFEISCSGKYLQDAVKSIDNDDVYIKFSGELRPIIVKDKNNDSLIQLISPVRTYN